MAHILKQDVAIKMHLQLVEQFPQPIDHCLSLEGRREFSYPEPAANRGEGLLIKLFAAPWARAELVLEIVARSFQQYQDVVRKLSSHGQLNPQPDIRRLAAGAARRLILLRFNDLQCPHEWRGTCHYPG